MITLHKARADVRKDGPDERHLCVDGDRLCEIRRQRLDSHDQQDYLNRHSPKFSRMDLAVVLLAAVSLVGVIGAGLARSRHPLGSEMIAKPILEHSHADDAAEIDDMFDLRR